MSAMNCLNESERRRMTRSVIDSSSFVAAHRSGSTKRTAFLFSVHKSSAKPLQAAWTIEIAAAIIFSLWIVASRNGALFKPPHRFNANGTQRKWTA
jgi:hypothetical protein